jgi:hypothetical protein
MNPVLADVLTARLEITVTAPWKTYAHDAPRQGLGLYLGHRYGLNAEIELIDADNDGTYRFDLRGAALDADHPVLGAETQRAPLMADVAKGYVSLHHLRALLTLAIVDGHVPAAVYVISH